VAVKGIWFECVEIIQLARDRVPRNARVLSQEGLHSAKLIHASIWAACTEEKHENSRPESEFSNASSKVFKSFVSNG
jgi:hypothetical protein